MTRTFHAGMLCALAADCGRCARALPPAVIIDIDLPMHVHLAPLLPFHKIANGYYNLHWRIG